MGHTSKGENFWDVYEKLKPSSICPAFVVNKEENTKLVIEGFLMLVHLKSVNEGRNAGGTRVLRLEGEMFWESR